MMMNIVQEGAVLIMMITLMVFLSPSTVQSLNISSNASTDHEPFGILPGGKRSNATHVAVSAAAKQLGTNNTLVMQWAGSYCHPALRNPRKPSAKLPTTFTIHGLWLDVPPCKPNSQAEGFDEGKLPSQMTNLWPTLRNDRSNIKFWTQEWNKHGKCTNPLMGVKDYFSKTIELSKGLNVLMFLKEFNIVPAKSYELNSYIITNLTGTDYRPAVQCADIPGAGLALQELRFCVDAAGTRIVPELKNAHMRNLLVTHAGTQREMNLYTSPSPLTDPAQG